MNVMMQLKLASGNYGEDTVAEAIRAIYNLTVCVENASAENNELRRALEDRDVTLNMSSCD